MNLPFFSTTDDPGPNFALLLNRLAASGVDPLSAPDAAVSRGFAHSADFAGYPSFGNHQEGGISVAHGTTIVALRFAGGTVMAGDRRATEGISIAHRKIEKVFPADSHSGVAIAGAAGPAVEMVRLFQTQLEHYEKVEGLVLSLEGKANQLSQMIRANLGMAMQGLVVIPLFAGYDQSRQEGRIFSYDVTGGRYEETEFHATGSGGRDAKSTIKLGYRVGLAERDAVRLAVKALFEAAEEDAATGGPDPARGIYPIVATITKDGFKKLDEDELAEVFTEILQERNSRLESPKSSGPENPGGATATKKAASSRAGKKSTGAGN